jgi:prolipoprotein diacylglyceryl transferase
MHLLAAIPSPPSNAVHLGPLQLRAYGLMIALGVIAAVYWGERRWAARGGHPGDISAIALWAVPAGILGARLYHVVTDYELYTHDPWRAFAIWDGGLGIPGGIAAGVLAGYVVARRRHLPIPPLLDTVAPTLPLAQAIGRWGNWFNQELYGRPTSLPWAVHIDPAHRPVGLEHIATYHPTFLYESLWNLALVGIILLVERSHRLRPGRLFAVYVAGYALGRFFIERLRIDYAHTIAGLRVNEWVSLVLFVAATIAIATGRNPEPHTASPGPHGASEPSTMHAPSPASSETDLAEGHRRPSSTV